MHILKTRAIALCLLLLTAVGCGDSGPDHNTLAWPPAASASGLEASDELCAGHAAPRELCFICDPELREPGRLWCAGHERYEDRCFLCHPELEDPQRLWCSEHNLYEDECTLCHPELRTGTEQRPAAGRSLYCREHDVAESECGICHPELAAGLAPGSGLKLRFESARSASLAGVEIGRPAVAAGAAGISFLARVSWNENNYARVTPLAAGVLREVVADMGQEVVRGQRLATLHSPEIAELKSTYLEAAADARLTGTLLERERELAAQRISARQDLDHALATHEVARTRKARARQLLLDHGLDEAAIHHLESTATPSSEFHVRAPHSGTIVHRDAVAGESVKPGQALFELAQLDTMWLELSVPEQEISQVVVSRELVASFNLYPGLEARGRVSWIGASIDPETRMVRARAELDNRHRRLRHGMFGRAHMAGSEKVGSIWIPRDAVQYLDQEPFIFARLEDDLYELRKVVLGPTSGDRIAVREGLGAEEEIVVTHSFTLKSELLKSRLGAGCVDH